MRTLFALLATLVMGQALAQATATPRATDPSLIFDLLGTVNTIEVSLPDEVRHLVVIAMHEGEIVLEADSEITVDAASAAVSAGVLSDAAGCPLLLFADLALFRHDGREHSGSRATMCSPLDAPGGVRTGWSPLATLPVPLDLPLDTWLAVETYGLTASEPAAGSDAIGGDLVFYLRLSTQEGDALPDPPSYETWGEMRDAFR